MLSHRCMVYTELGLEKNKKQNKLFYTVYRSTKSKQKLKCSGKFNKNAEKTNENINNSERKQKTKHVKIVRIRLSNVSTQLKSVDKL